MSSTVLALLYGAAFCVPFVATLGFTPIAGRVARRLGILDVPQQNKFHRQATPYLGGVAVAVGVVLVGAVAGSARGQLLTVLLCGLAVAVVGLVDDWRTVRPEMKLVVEIAAGLALWFVGIRASIFGVYELDLAMTVLWVVAVTNALNLVDNMDGLSSGLACICAFSFFALAASRGHYFRGSLALAIAGSSLSRGDGSLLPPPRRHGPVDPTGGRHPVRRAARVLDRRAGVVRLAVRPGRTDPGGAGELCRRCPRPVPPARRTGDPGGGAPDARMADGVAPAGRGARVGRMTLARVRAGGRASSTLRFAD